MTNLIPLALFASFALAVGLWNGSWARLRDRRNTIRIRHKWGAGEWFPESSRAELEAWVAAMERKYPSGRHWIEERAAP